MTVSKNPEEDFPYDKILMYLLNDSSFFFKYKHRYIRLMVSEILWIKADGSSIEIFTEKEKYVICTNLKSFLLQVPHKSLKRVHRSFAVNLNSVSAFNENSLIIKIANREEKIPFGQSYRADVFSSFIQVKST